MKKAESDQKTRRMRVEEEMKQLWMQMPKSNRKYLPEASTGGAKVLLIEDARLLRQTMQEGLDDLDYVIETMEEAKLEGIIVVGHSKLTRAVNTFTQQVARVVAEINNLILNGLIDKDARR